MTPWIDPVRNAHSMQEPGEDLGVGWIEYDFTLLGAKVHVREGHWGFVEEVIGLPILFSDEWRSRGYSFLTGVSRRDSMTILSLVVSDISESTGPKKRLAPGISFTVTAPSNDQAREAFMALVDRTTLRRPEDSGSALTDIVGTKRIHSLMSALENPPNKAPDRTAPSVTPPAAQESRH